MFKNVLKNVLLTVVETWCLFLDIIIGLIDFYVNYCDLALGLVELLDGESFNVFERFCIKATRLFRTIYSHYGKWLKMLRSPFDEILEKNGR